MALASQNSRSERNAGSARRRSDWTFVLVSAIAFVAIAGIIWTLRGASQSTTIRSAEASEEPMIPTPSEPRRTALEDALATTGAGHSDPAAEAKANEPTTTDPSKDAAPAADTKPADQAAPTAAPTTTTPATTTPATTTPATTTPTGPATSDEKPTDANPTAPAFGNGFDPSKTPSVPTANPPATDTPAGKLAEAISLAASEPVKSRAMLSTLVIEAKLDPSETRTALGRLAQINEKLFLTPVFNAADPLFTQYTVQPGDSLEKIVRKNKCGCDWRFVARINNIKNPAGLQVGKRIKLPKGPFSAIVTKDAYRIDLISGEGFERVIVASRPVGLGESNGTPLGRFRVKPGSKLLNPEWNHPVTGQRFAADDPMNPIGEHWLGLEGLDVANSALKGYGIHGTIEFESIGHDQSLGCVRLLPEDVAIIWEALADGSIVEIRR
jgi:L,D-transpeptidase catalytic domain/LysM domain